MCVSFLLTIFSYYRCLSHELRNFATVREEIKVVWYSTGTRGFRRWEYVVRAPLYMQTATRKIRKKQESPLVNDLPRGDISASYSDYEEDTKAKWQKCLNWMGPMTGGET